jgi:hypothetical protein
MNHCPQCHTESPTTAVVCPKCRADLSDVVATPTLHTKPRLLILRPAPQPAAARSMVHGTGSAPHTDSMPTPTLMPPPRLRVIRGLKINTEYPLCDGSNLIGRGDDRPVDIDLRDQEPRDHVWASRNHAVITLADGQLTVEDLNSMNGTYVNRHRVHPGQKRTLRANDVLQIGTVQLKLTL